MNEEKQKLENLLKILDNDLIQCCKCLNKYKKHQMIDLYSYSKNKHDYMCKSCFKK